MGYRPKRQAKGNRPLSNDLDERLRSLEKEIKRIRASVEKSEQHFRYLSETMCGGSYKGAEKGVSRKSGGTKLETAGLKQAKQALRTGEGALNMVEAELVGANKTLETMLRAMEESIQELKEEMISNVKQMILPYLRELKKGLDGRESALVRNIESNLDSLTSPLAKKLALKPIGLTPTELQIAGLVRDGNSSKQIAGLLNISRKTVDFHRQNLRRKVGLDGRKANLRGFLMSFS